MKLKEICTIAGLGLAATSCEEPFPYSSTPPMDIMTISRIEGNRFTMQTCDLGIIPQGNFENSFLVVSFPLQTYPELKDMSGRLQIGDFNFYYDDANKNKKLDNCQELRGVRFTLKNRIYNLKLDCSYIKTIQNNSPFNYNPTIRYKI